MRSQVLTLPEPPSSNRYWRSLVLKRNGELRSVVLLSREAKAYREAVQAAFFGQWDHRAGARLVPFEGPIALTLTWYRSRRAGDLSNRIKVVEDALKGLAYVDDKQVVRIIAYREDAPRQGSLSVVVEELP